MENRNQGRLSILIVFIFISYLPAITAVFVKTGGWYNTLSKPFWTPPSWIFGPAWTILYGMIALSGFLAWSSIVDRQQRILPFTIFGLQLIANALWTVLFFHFHDPFAAFIDIFVLVILILLLIVFFYPLSKKASLLLIPYALWVFFASCLNFAIYVLN